MKSLEDTIYIDSVPLIEYKSGTDGFLYIIRYLSRRKYMLSVVQTAEFSVLVIILLFLK